MEAARAILPRRGVGYCPGGRTAGSCPVCGAPLSRGCEREEPTRPWPRTSPAPEGVGPEKYDATATSMVGLLKYGAGLPFNRIETLQAGMGIPLPAATQWDLVRKAAPVLAPAHAELLHQAAQAPVLYNDDTTMKVLQLTRAQRAAALADDAHTEYSPLTYSFKEPMKRPVRPY